MTVRLLQGPNSGFRDFDSARLFRDYEQDAVHQGGGRGRARRAAREAAGGAVDQCERRDRPDRGQAADRPRSWSGNPRSSRAPSWRSCWGRPGTASRRTRTSGRGWSSACGIGTTEAYQLGPHAPPLTPEDVELIHQLWLEAVSKYGLDVHHRDVVRTAIEDLAGDMTPEARRRAVERVGEHLGRRRPADSAASGPGLNVQIPRGLRSGQANQPASRSVRQPAGRRRAVRRPRPHLDRDPAGARRSDRARRQHAAFAGTAALGWSRPRGRPSGCRAGRPAPCPPSAGVNPAISTDALSMLNGLRTGGDADRRGTRAAADPARR